MKYYKILGVILSFLLFCTGCSENRIIRPKTIVLHEENINFKEAKVVSRLFDELGSNFEMYLLGFYDGNYFFATYDKIMKGTTDIYCFNLKDNKLKNIYKPDFDVHGFRFRSIVPINANNQFLVSYYSGDDTTIEPYETGILQIMNHVGNKLIQAKTWNATEAPTLQLYNQDIYFFLPDLEPIQDSFDNVEYHFDLYQYSKNKLKKLVNQSVKVTNYQYNINSGTILYSEGSVAQFRPIPCDGGVCFITSENGTYFLNNTNEKFTKTKFVSPVMLYGYIHGQYILREVDYDGNDLLYLYNSDSKQRINLQWFPEKLNRASAISNNEILFIDNAFKLYRLKVSDKEHIYTEILLPKEIGNYYYPLTDGNHIVLTNDNQLFYTTLK